MSLLLQLADELEGFLEASARYLGVPYDPDATYTTTEPDDSPTQEDPDA